VLATEPDEVPIFVDELHPDVVAMVEEIMANVKFEDADLPVTEIAIETLMEAIATAQEDRLERLPSAPRYVLYCDVFTSQGYSTPHPLQTLLGWFIDGGYRG